MLKVNQMKSVLVRIPEALAKLLDELVSENRFPSRNEAIREAIRDLLKEEKKL